MTLFRPSPASRRVMTLHLKHTCDAPLMQIPLRVFLADRL